MEAGPIGRIGLVLERDVLFEGLDVTVGDLFGEAGEHLTFQAHAGFEDVMRLRQARLGDGRPLFGCRSTRPSALSRARAVRRWFG